MYIAVWILIGVGVGYISHNYFSHHQRGGFIADLVLSVLGAIEGGYLYTVTSGIHVQIFSVAALVSALCGAAFFVGLQRLFAKTPVSVQD